tara:strand:+ start:292 stop:456 length:165 start_codon:yes stop_codon:yes gene_type:complete
MVLIHLGGGVTILELEKGFWDSDKCIEYVSKLNSEAYCVPKYVEIGKVQNVNRR